MLVVSPRVVKILISLRVFGTETRETESHPFRCRLVGLSTVRKEIYEKCSALTLTTQKGIKEIA